MKSHRRQLTRFHTGWSVGRPPLVMILIALNVAAFVLQIVVDGLLFPRNPYVVSFTTEWFALSRAGIAAGHYWQFITYMFLHGNLMHLLANMLGLYFAGRQVEAIIGRTHFLWIYFLGGLAGGIAQMGFGFVEADLMRNVAGLAPLLGASAGVLAILIAFTTILPELEIKALVMFVLPVRMRAKYLGWGMAGSSGLFLVLNLAGVPIFDGWAHAAHLGGCAVGWGYIKQLGYGNPMALQRYVFERRERNARYERMPTGQFISEEIDPILDKISREGIHSLSRSEKKILERGRDKIARRTSGRR